MNNATKHTDRIAAVQSWLLKSDWTVEGTTYDYTPLVNRAMQTFGYPERRRARVLVDKAARLLRGNVVAVMGGRPSHVRLNVLKGRTLIFQRQALDLSVDESFLVTALNGNGTEVEFQYIRPDGMTEIITLRVPDTV